MPPEDNCCNWLSVFADLKEDCPELCAATTQKQLLILMVSKLCLIASGAALGDREVVCGDDDNLYILDTTASPPITYDLNGNEVTGVTIVPCPTKLESDAVDVCQDGITQLIMWVVKSEGQPTGEAFFMDISGAIVPEPDSYTFGKCGEKPIFTTPKCYYWDDSGTIEKVTAFAQYDCEANFLTWVVLSGNEPADLTAADALEPCENLTTSECEGDLPEEGTGVAFAPIDAYSTAHTYQWNDVNTGQDMTALLGCQGPWVSSAGLAGINFFYDFSSIPECATIAGVRIRHEGLGGSGNVYWAAKPSDGTQYPLLINGAPSVPNRAWHHPGAGCNTSGSYTETQGIGFPCGTVRPSAAMFESEIEVTGLTRADLDDFAVRIAAINSGNDAVGCTQVFVDWTVENCTGGIDDDLAAEAITTKICLPTQEVEDCAGNVSEVKALPATVEGVVDVKICPEPELPTCDTQYNLLCDRVGVDVTQFLRAIQICTLDNQIISTTALGDFQLDATTPYTVQGIEEQCTNVPFDEEVLCDYGTTPKTRFIRRTTVITNIGVIFEEVELDGITPYVPVGPVDICSEECLKPMGKEKCYGAGTGDAQYINADNTTDISFSIGGGAGFPDMKWPVQVPAEDGAEVFTLAVVDCINAGNTATITITDQDGLVYTYVGTGIGNNGNGDGTGDYYFTGPGSPAPGSGKVREAVLTCSSSTGSGRACAFWDCDAKEIVWIDSETYEQLSPAQVETLEDCPLPEQCEESTTEVISCASETGITDDGTPVAVGDQIFTIVRVDCNNVVLSGLSYHLNSGETVSGILTEQCDPQPDVEQTRECIKDTQGVEWTQVQIIDPGPPSAILFEFYYNRDTQEIGTPAGEASEWASCLEPQFSQCKKWKSLVVGVDNTGTRYNETYTIQVTFSDGSVNTFDQTPTGGWTAQINQWAASLQNLLPDAVVEPRCNLPAGCGGLLPPNSDANFTKMAYRYVDILTCPGRSAPIKMEILSSSNPIRIGKTLVLEYIETPEKHGYVCYNCGEAPVLHLDDGSLVPDADLPLCTFACAEQYPEIPTQTCQSSIETGCDDVNDTDSNNWATGIVRQTTICQGSPPTVSYFEPDPGDPTALVDYALVGNFVDCSSGVPIEPPQIQCFDFVSLRLLYRVGVSAAKGVSTEYWAPTAQGGNAAVHDNVSVIFDTDFFTHTNGAPDHVGVEADWTFNSTNISGTFDSNAQDQWIAYSYIYLKEETLINDVNINTGERGAFWLDQCCLGNFTKVSERATDSTIPSDRSLIPNGVTLPAGIHRIGVQVSDFSAFSGVDLEGLVGFVDKPKVECIPIIKCKDTGILLNAIDGLVVTIDSEFDSWCKPEVCENIDTSPKTDCLGVGIVGPNHA